MKERELREAADCGICGKPFGHTGFPAFWRVRIERHGVDAGAVTRQQGLAMMMGGNAALAMAMGPDEEMTKPLMDPMEMTVCERCALEQRLCLAELTEYGKGDG